MKIRTDFVTNSSSSCFILARKGELTETQKNIIIKYVENMMLGTKILTSESTENDIRKICRGFSEEDIEQVKDTLREGKDVYMGAVHFDDCVYELADLYISLWESLEEADKESFARINGDLDY